METRKPEIANFMICFPLLFPSLIIKRPTPYMIHTNNVPNNFGIQNEYSSNAYGSQATPMMIAMVSKRNPTVIACV